MIDAALAIQLSGAMVFFLGRQGLARSTAASKSPSDLGDQLFATREAADPDCPRICARCTLKCGLERELGMPCSFSPSTSLRTGGIRGLRVTGQHRYATVFSGYLRIRTLAG